MATPPTPDELARNAVSLSASSMIARLDITPFKEELGSTDYLRWRKDLVLHAQSAGMDFSAALLTDRVIAAAGNYTDAMIDADDASGLHTLTMPQIRQHALLTCIKKSFERAS